MKSDFRDLSATELAIEMFKQFGGINHGTEMKESFARHDRVDDIRGLGGNNLPVTSSNRSMSLAESGSNFAPKPAEL